MCVCVWGGGAGNATMIEKQFQFLFCFHYHIQNAKAQELFFFIVGQVLRVKFFSGKSLLHDFSRAMLQKQYWTTQQLITLELILYF